MATDNQIVSIMDMGRYNMETILPVVGGAACAMGQLICAEGAQPSMEDLQDQNLDHEIQCLLEEELLGMIEEELLVCEIESAIDEDFRTNVDRTVGQESLLAMLSLPEQQFRHTFRVNRNTFQKLVLELTSVLDPFGSSSRDKADVFTIQGTSVQVAAGLYVLGHGCTLSAAGIILGLGKSTVHKYFVMFLNAMKHIYSSLIAMPSEAKMNKYSEQFATTFRAKGARWVPQIVGAMERSHVFINKPTIDPEDYHCYKLHFSVALQILVAPTTEILHACFGAPGSVTDGQVFQASKLLDVLPESSAILGNCSLPSSERVITPYRASGMATVNPKRKRFNLAQSAGRACVERTSGYLKGRWRILLFVHSRDFAIINHTLYACCILHNLCLQISDFPAPDEFEQNDEDRENIEQEESHDDNTVRDRLCNKMFG